MTEVVEVRLFVANEECDTCQDYVMVAIVVAADMAICKDCFDKLFEQAQVNRKRQITCS